MPNGNGEHLRATSSVSIEKYIDTRFDELRLYTGQRFADLETAVDKSERSLNLRLDSMNEFRGALKDAQAQCITRTEYNLAHEFLEKKTQDLEISKAVLEGKASQSALNITYIVMAVNMLISLVLLALRLLGR